MPDIYTVDFESMYDTDYSLSKMQTEAYVEDARFETIGMGIGKNDGNIHWFTEPSDITHVLDRINWDNCAVRAHNTHFDGLILSHRYGKNPAQWRDTLASGRMMRPHYRQHSLGYMAKALGLPDKGNEVIAAKGKRRADFTPAELHAYGEYCKLDTALCRTIGDIFDPYTPALYEYLIDMTVRMFTEPALVGNRQKMQELYQAELDRKARLLLDASVDRSIIMSGDKLARALLDLGVVAPRKVSPKTGKETWAFAKTDKVFCDLLEHEDPQVQALVAARLGVKSTIAETRAKTYAEMTDRGPLRVFLSMWGAKTTGRYSGTNKANWQNLPARGPAAGLREAICAPVGHQLVVGDSSNIELRTVMCLAGQWDVVEKIRNGVDLYCDFASRLFGRTITKADKAERQLGKVACIAEGQLVLTDKGLVPIEEITLSHSVWDGVDFVHHDGVVFKGVRDVIEYDGITATADHVVCLENGAWCKLGDAAGAGARVATTERGGAPVWFMGCAIYGAARDAREGGLPVRLRAADVGRVGEPAERNIDTMQGLRYDGAARAGRGAAARDSVGGGVGTAGAGHAGSLHTATESAMGVVRRARDRVSVLVREGVRGALAHASRVFYGAGSGSTGERWALRAWESSLRHAGGAASEPEKYGAGADLRWPSAAGGLAQPVQPWAHVHLRGEAGHASRGDHSAGTNSRGRETEELAGAARPAGRARVYDIVNAGPRHRFTVSGKLVHNCLSLQYGAGAPRFQEMVRMESTRNPDMKPISIERAMEVVALYRQIHHKVVDLWNYCNDVVLPAIARGDFGRNVDVNGWFIVQNEGFGRPGEPGVMYHDLRYDAKEREWTYQMGNERVRIFGPKLVENLSQHAAMIIVMWQTARINTKFPVKLSVHDEAVTVPEDARVAEAKAYVLECLSLAPVWCRGVIPVAGEVGVGTTYAGAK